MSLLSSVMAQIIRAGGPPPGGGFPSVSESAGVSSNSTGGTDHPVTIPSRAVGNLLLVCMRVGSDPSAVPAGWTEIAIRGVGAGAVTGIYARIATNDSSDNFNLTTGTAVRSAAVVFVIAGAASTTGAVEAIFADTNVMDPPELTPTFGAADILWLAGVSSSRSHDWDTVVISTDYDSGVYAQSNPGLTNNAFMRIGVARRELNAASEDPSAWTIDSPRIPHAFTIAIQPA